MKARWFLCAVLCAGSIGFFGGVGFSEDPMPSEEEMMKVMKAYATPGAGHKIFDSLVGDWDTVATNMMNPTKPDVSKGRATNRLILDGRYLHQQFIGSWSGMPHRGTGFLGYDNHLKRYQNVWVDNFGTGIAPAEGTGGEDGKTINLTYVWDGPLGTMKGRMRYTVTSKDSHTLEGWHTMGEGGQEMKSMEIVFTRKKPAVDCPPR